MVQSVRGMHDVLPEEARLWRHVEDELSRVLLEFSYEEVRLPLMEPTELFSRGVGEATDIVEKEMYTLLDRDGDSLSLRPEGTAGCVRALQQHGKLYNQTQRVFYTGPMFRYERPQKGRYRQFYQVGAETFGFAGPDIDGELLLLAWEFWCQLGISDQVTLEINTLGSSAARAAYRRALVDYLKPLKEDLDADSQRRMETNPLRILDSKVPRTQEILAGAPNLPQFVDAESAAHFAELQRFLEISQLPFQVNTRLVRGLDYYTHTVFEWVTGELGSQGAVCAGGRYDGLVERLGGKPTPAAGFAVGLDRVCLLVGERLESGNDPLARQLQAATDVYCCIMEAQHVSWTQALSATLRRAIPGLRVRCHAGGGKLSNQLRKADQSGAEWALIVGSDEVSNNRVTVKSLRKELPQQSLGTEALIEVLRGQTD